MADDSGKALGLGAIFALIITIGLVVGALLGMLREPLGMSALVAGGLAGLVVGGLSSILFRRRAGARRSGHGS